MTMHLEGPWLSTTGKHKTKRRWQSAEQKAKAQRLADEWSRKQEEFVRMAPKFSGKPVTVKKPEIADSLPKIPPGRETPHIPSHTTPGGLCSPVKDMTYTGSKVKGIGTMHKSNGVPIFSDDEAKDISSMRR